VRRCASTSWAQPLVLFWANALLRNRIRFLHIGVALGRGRAESLVEQTAHDGARDVHRGRTVDLQQPHSHGAAQPGAGGQHSAVHRRVGVVHHGGAPQIKIMIGNPARQW